MAFTSITKPAQGDPIKKSLIDLVIDDLADLNSRITPTSNAGVLNGSFEVATVVTVADSWTKTLYTGGSGGQSSAASTHGTYSYAFTSPGGAGNGGGYLDSTDFIPVSVLRTYELSFQLKSTVAGVKNLVSISWYDAAQAFISTTDYYSSTANPTVWTLYRYTATAVAGAYFAKIKLTGCHTASTTAGTTYFDDVSFTDKTSTTGAAAFTANGTWTCPAGVGRVLVKMWGGGGGGSGGAGGSAGGGGGAYLEIYSSVTPGTAYSVTVGAAGAAGAGVGGAGGAGGSSTFNSLTAAGGSGGVVATGGAGGTGATIDGESGVWGNIPTAVDPGGYGGAAFGGARAHIMTGQKYGGGGAGSVATSGVGLAGAAGLVLINY